MARSTSLRLILAVAVFIGMQGLEYVGYVPNQEQTEGVIDSRIDPWGTAETLIWGAERSLYILATIGERPADEVVDSTAAVWLRAIYGLPR